MERHYFLTYYSEWDNEKKKGERVVLLGLNVPLRLITCRAGIPYTIVRMGRDDSAHSRRWQAKLKGRLDFEISGFPAAWMIIRFGHGALMRLAQGRTL